MGTTPPQHLGDSHNFGRRVAKHDDRIVKPRTVFWEWLFLSLESPLRQYLVTAAERAGLPPQTFAFLPDLKFTHRRTREGAREGGEVEALRLDPLPVTLSVEEKRDFAGIVGKSLAFWSYFGVADLHWENIALGRDAQGRIILTPLDIEMVFADLSLPTETKWLPDADPEVADICRHAAGVRRVLPYLGKPVDVGDLLIIASHYVQMLDFLMRRGREITEVLANLPELNEMPIRVCLRGTDEYVQTDDEPLWPPLLEEEMEQLDRGDIPYFFRLYGKQGIHYFGNEELTEIETLPTDGDVPQLDPQLEISRGFRSKLRKTLQEEGLLTVLGAFDHKSFKGTQTHNGLEVTFQKNTLILKFPDGEEIEAHRDLSDFVASVYLPCNCGEVQTVFVPEVTKCSST